MFAVIDIHCHILAEVDDGPKSWDVAQEMCRIAAADGIEHIVATPHANERYHYDRHYLAGLVHYLRQQVGSAPKLSLGCDFHFSYDNLQDALDAPGRYTIEGSNYLLVELSNYSVPVQLDECFTRLREVGVTAVITHPERNPILQRTPENGCSSATPSMCWPAMLMTASIAPPYFPQDAPSWRSSAARILRAHWSKTTR